MPKPGMDWYKSSYWCGDRGGNKKIHEQVGHQSLPRHHHHLSNTLACKGPYVCACQILVRLFPHNQCTVVVQMKARNTESASNDNEL